MKQTMTFETFERLCAQGRPIPLTAETLADLETPVSALARVADHEGVFLLESCGQGGRFSRYSFWGSLRAASLRWKTECLTFQTQQGSVRCPLTAHRWMR